MSRKNRKPKQSNGEIVKVDGMTRTEARMAASKTAMLENLERTGGAVTISAQAVGITRQAHYLWLDNDPEYDAAVRSIQERCLDVAESVIWQTLTGADERSSDRLTAAKLLLAAKGKDRGYGSESRKLEHSGKIETDSKIEVVRVVHFPSNNTDTTAIPLPASWETATSIHKPG